MPETAEPQPWHALYWRAWDALRYDRPYGAMGGEMPIPFGAFDTYARRWRIEGQDFDLFHTLMTAIDGEWLAFQAEKASEERDRRRLANKQ